MREFLGNLLIGTLGVTFALLAVVCLFTDVRVVDRQIIEWKASVFGAP